MRLLSGRRSSCSQVTRGSASRRSGVSALDNARQRGVRVLAHRAVEAEAVLSFAGISELLADVVDDVLPSLGDLRRGALEAMLLLHDRGDEPADPRAIALAFLDSLRTLAAEAPVLVTVDDFQWFRYRRAGPHPGVRASPSQAGADRGAAHAAR